MGGSDIAPAHGKSTFGQGRIVQSERGGVARRVEVMQRAKVGELYSSGMVIWCRVCESTAGQMAVRMRLEAEMGWDQAEGV